MILNINKLNEQNTDNEDTTNKNTFYENDSKMEDTTNKNPIFEKDSNINIETIIPKINEYTPSIASTSLESIQQVKYIKLIEDKAVSPSIFRYYFESLKNLDPKNFVIGNHY